MNQLFIEGAVFPQMEPHPVFKMVRVVAGCLTFGGPLYLLHKEGPPATREALQRLPLPVPTYMRRCPAFPSVRACVFLSVRRAEVRGPKQSLVHKGNDWWGFFFENL